MAVTLACLGPLTFPNQSTKERGHEIHRVVDNPQSSVTASEARFLKTGAPPPAGVKMLGRWHGMSGGGVLIAETDDAKALYSWLAFGATFWSFKRLSALKTPRQAR